MICSAERLHELRRISRTPVEYPSPEFNEAQMFLAAGVPELLDTIEGLCRVIVYERETMQEMAAAFQAVAQ